MLTAVLNAGSMLVTSAFVFQQIGIAGSTVGAPPVVPMLWLFVALVPLSCLFSALALAVAAMARSSKEGQYYLMPLMMVTLPLVMLPILPGMNLTAGTSLVRLPECSCLYSLSWKVSSQRRYCTCRWYLG